MSKQKFYKWNSYVDLTIEDVVKLFDSRGIVLNPEEAVITGSTYSPDIQLVRVHVSSLVTPKRDRELSKIWGLPIDQKKE